MSDDWPRGWYSDEPDRPGAPGQRPQPGFTPSSPGQGWYADDSRGTAGAGQTAWPAQPPSRSWTGGPQGRPGRRGWRRWLRPRRVLAILAGLVVLLVLAAVGTYFSVSSKLTKADVLVPTSLTSAGANWLITGSDSRAGRPCGPPVRLRVGGWAGHALRPAPAVPRLSSAYQPWPCELGVKPG